MGSRPRFRRQTWLRLSVWRWKEVGVELVVAAEVEMAGQIRVRASCAASFANGPMSGADILAYLTRATSTLRLGD